ncbi:long-chain fatty acid transport protein 6 [Rana temporaria]|uniref:long-chain fatty acid transport protein 6 n=1 Tax=Rana temporaria TaxID=8407 RepID=UPI001AAC556B|nr:long-chain fatty acid transport protein 6 [Rana temporaria]XP_040200812.1 long-chain fatty acid transport protein 6 [Rana temporaria]XP_040200823.1 long-chain fatty acid transport protein 6 [Rana temporaria]XP_040200834.1 long-chain fatty acid transport protein 6 [Rana temporaria]
MALCWITGLVAGLAALHFLQKKFFPYFWVDLKYLLKVVRYGLLLEAYKKTGHVVTVVDRFIQQAQRVPDKAFIIFHGEVHTYRDVDRRSNQVSHCFLKHTSLKKGDTVAMLMNNEPDFLNVWFGLAKLGCLVAFLNYNIRSRSLLHCFHSCGAKILIVGADLLDSLEEILPSLQEDNITVWVMAKESSLPGVNTVLDKLDSVTDKPVPAHLRFVGSTNATTLYIFTSGTTGLPKAAVISQLQALRGAAGIWAFGGYPDDVVYITLPLYHSAASLIGIGGCVYLGATCVLRKKFSASQFWIDCKKNNVTVFQYIGELCRYLCKQPVREGEKDHKVRMAVGNGVRSDVWKEFIARFGDIKMCELYGATEGNICFMNHTGKIGAVGRTGFFYKLAFPFELIKYDIQKDEPIKNKHGWCERVKKGDAGLLLSKVNHTNPFFGYAGNKKHTTKKLMCDVFKKGDVYFNSGDLMMQDYNNFLYFRDRIGDTFRWKGENVATTEVSDIIGMLDFIQEANVYGVSVSGHEGKVGMASIILKPGQALDLKSIFEHCKAYLPAYAFPRFLRLQENMEVTGTFKQQKFRLVEQGFDPTAISDPLYFLDDSKQSYVPMTKDIYDKITNGLLKL